MPLSADTGSGPVAGNAKAASRLHGCLLATMEATPGLVMVWTMDGLLQYVSGMCREVLDVIDDGSQGRRSVYDLYAPASRDLLLREAVPVCLGGGVWRGEMTLMDGRCNEIPVSQVLMAHRVVDPVEGGTAVLSGIAWDIREMKQLERKLRHQATHDDLTGLPNRQLFSSRLDQAIRIARLDQTCVAVLYLDLDGFKLINDTRGHGAGDALLREFGRRLALRLRAQDTIARFGGDEFVVLIAGLASPADVGRIVQQVRELMLEPFSIGGEPVKMEASIGFAMYPFDGPDGASLLRRADKSMYRQKRGLQLAVRPPPAAIGIGLASQPGGA